MGKYLFKTLKPIKFSDGGTAGMDTILMDDMKLFIENDGDLYRQQFQPIRKNLMAKLAKGVYDHDKAAKLFVYLIESGDKKYSKEGGGHHKGYMLTVPERKALSKEFEHDFYEQAKAGDYDEYIPKKYANKEIKY